MDLKSFAHTDALVVLNYEGGLGFFGDALNKSEIAHFCNRIWGGIEISSASSEDQRMDYSCRNLCNTFEASF